MRLTTVLLARLVIFTLRCSQVLFRSKYFSSFLSMGPPLVMADRGRTSVQGFHRQTAASWVLKISPTQPYCSRLICEKDIILKKSCSFLRYCFSRLIFSFQSARVFQLKHIPPGSLSGSSRQNHHAARSFFFPSILLMAWQYFSSRFKMRFSNVKTCFHQRCYKTK